jgi:hypothetical protein
MTTIQWIVVVALAILAIAFIASLFLASGRRTEGMRRHYGEEYERVVEQHGKARGEEMLEAPERRVEQLDIHPLPPEQRQTFSEAWNSVQAAFVNDPGKAVGDADRLVHEVMKAEGYPMDKFEERAADISVKYPDVVAKYREAHNIELAREQGKASTEDLRKAMVDYRALFEHLLGARTRERTGA